MTQPCGASPAEWDHFALNLDLVDDLMPVVSNPGATISPNSKMKGIGKTPSIYNNKHQVVGIANWTQSHSSMGDIDRWRSESDYGICIQTRNVRAIDCDIHDQQLAKVIEDEIIRHLKQILPARRRPNSPKFLLAFTMGGDFQKRKILTEGGIIEFLATGQQFIAVGRHTSGAHYEWTGGLPEHIPELTAAEFESLWNRMVECFAVEPPTESRAPSKHTKLSEAINNDPIAQHLYASSLVRSAERDGRLHIVCPFESEHTSDSADSSTTYFPARTGGYERGHFHCLHAHCEGKTRSEFLAALDYSEGADDFDIVDDAATTAGSGEAEDATDDAYTFESLEVFNERKPPTWIIKGVLPEAALGFFYGESGSGKTFFALDVALAIATGIEWRGHKVTQGTVAYIAAEDAPGVGHRIRAYRRRHDLENVNIPFHILPAAPNFTEKDDVKKVLRGLRKLGEVRVVFVDTWAQVTPGADENSGAEMGKALGFCNALHRATGALIVLIHHSGKDASKGARGWSGMRGAADCMIEVNRFNDEREAVVVKLKNAADGTRFGFKLHTVVVAQDEDGDDITSCVVEHTRAKSKAERTADSKPMHANHKLIYDVICDLAVAGPVDREKLIEDGDKYFKDKLATEARRAVRRAVEALVKSCKVIDDNGFLSIPGGDGDEE